MLHFITTMLPNTNTNEMKTQQHDKAKRDDVAQHDRDGEREGENLRTFLENGSGRNSPIRDNVCCCCADCVCVKYFPMKFSIALTSGLGIVFFFFLVGGFKDFFFFFLQDAQGNEGGGKILILPQSSWIFFLFVYIFLDFLIFYLWGEGGRNRSENGAANC